MPPPNRELSIDFPLSQTQTRLTFDWAESYDSENFSLLSSILAPSITLDYNEALN
jgi:scytalone dehydratase